MSGSFLLVRGNLKKRGGNKRSSTLSTLIMKIIMLKQYIMGFRLYGLKSLFSVWPCLSSPCNYGGTCSYGPTPGDYSCQCKPEVSIRPFIDNNCNIGR